MTKEQLLGEWTPQITSFHNLNAAFAEFETKEFKRLVDRKRSEWVNRALLELIQKEKEPCFLLRAVLEFIERIEKEELLQHYTFTSFELWLNQHSGLSFEENCRVRGKIAGKWIERSEYQSLFPIGTGKVYDGTHFVTAHRSPDLDTTIASFWGWLDSFAARVSSGLHVWNLPGGPPGSQIEIDLIFKDVFGEAIFTHLAKTRSVLTLTGNDLMSRKGFQSKTPDTPLSQIDHDRDNTSIVAIDEEGFYLGDWRAVDVEGVRQVMIALGSCLRWFENQLQLKLIALFSQEKVLRDDISPLLQELFHLKILSSEPASEFGARQNKEVNAFLIDVLGVKEGLHASFAHLAETLAQRGRIATVKELIVQMESAKLFNAKGELIEERPRLFHYLERTIRSLHEAIVQIRSSLEKLDLALLTKERVFGHYPSLVTVRSDVDEIRNRMGSHASLTVAYPDGNKFYPVGVIEAADLRKATLGTVSLRDFCNRDEMGIPSYLEVISVIDHHKSQLTTLAPALTVIGDAQSSNTLVAQLAFQINDRTSQGNLKQFDTPLENLKPSIASRLLQRRMAQLKKGHFFVSKEREFLEYLHFLYGILDDTDLLSKVTALDVEITASLLNRLKSLMLGEEVEIVSLDDLARDKNFPKRAAARLLQNKDLYSLYRKIYEFREKEVERNLSLAADKKPSNLFADTKEQNGCCRIGQTKIFAKNVPFFEKKVSEIRRFWLEISQKTHKEKPDIDLHLHMISTIVNAEEVFKGVQSHHEHRDELWIWAATNEMGTEHLKNFLSSFQNSPGLQNNPLEGEFLGDNAAELSQIFKESFMDIPQRLPKKADPHLPIAILRYNPGSLNSRKAMVSPFLPTLG